MEENKQNSIIYKIGEGVVSPLGNSVDLLFNALRKGESCSQYHENLFGLPEPFFGSIIDNELLDSSFYALENTGSSDYTKIEKAAIVAASQAIAESNIDASREDVIFILSTTKGNIDLLEANPYSPERLYLWHTAQLIADFFDNPNTPFVVSNACISGCAAQIMACRLLRYHNYKYAVVVGSEMLSKFVISGFQSFKALSTKRCQPFDKHRCGLNLGEAAAAIIYTVCDTNAALPEGTLIVRGGAINNDANHISGPSRTGEGLLLSINKALVGIKTPQLAFINAHGTATLYNDDMESIAIQRAQLQEVPTNSLKGYLGHTLGAAGILETLISARALREHIVLKTLGNHTAGTAAQINICQENTPTQGNCFLKLISGFGGSNAAMSFSLYTHATPSPQESIQLTATPQTHVIASCSIRPDSVTLNGDTLLQRTDEGDWLTHIYHTLHIQYPKYFKMDTLCKAGFLATEILLKDQQYNPDQAKTNWAIVLLNSVSSLCNDRKYQQTIASKENYYPSPAIFVYTLSNIITGEIAIRHKIQGESAFYLLPSFSEQSLLKLVQDTFQSNKELTHIVCGWVDVEGETLDVQMRLVALSNTCQ